MSIIDQSETTNTHEILLKIASNLNYMKVEANKIIVKYGEKFEHLYIILKGEVSILVPKEVKLKLTKEEYLNYLTLLKIYDEKELLHSCLQINRLSFKFDEKDIVKPNNEASRKFLVTKRSYISRISKIAENFVKTVICSIVCEKDYIDRIKQSNVKSEDTKEVILYEYNHSNLLKQGEVIANNMILNNKWYLMMKI